MQADDAVSAATGDNFADLPMVNHLGNPVLYGIVFSLDRVTGFPVDMHMRIKTAYPCTEQIPMTFGSVRFRYLVALRMKGKGPGRATSQHRKRPRVP